MLDTSGERHGRHPTAVGASFAMRTALPWQTETGMTVQRPQSSWFALPASGVPAQSQAVAPPLSTDGARTTSNVREQLRRNP
jgi:hypothetical protein